MTWYLKIIGCGAWITGAIAAPHNLLIQKFQNIRSIDAHFSQTVSLHGRQKSHSSGHFVVLRPGKILWSIESPHRQLLVANGETVWNYEPQLQQATRKAQSKGVGGTAGLFLSQQPNLWIQRYHVSIPRSDVFELKARSSKLSLTKVILRFQGDKLVGLDFWDQLGQYSQIKLSQVKMNPKVSLTTFQFKPPKNTDIIRL